MYKVRSCDKVKYKIILRTRDVSESSCHAVVFIEDDAWSFTLDTPSVPHLTLTGTHALRGVNLETRNMRQKDLIVVNCNIFCQYQSLRVAHLLDVIPCLKLLQEKHSFLSLLVSFNFIINYNWDFRNLLNAVT